MEKIQIKSIDNEVLFELEKENNTLKDAIEKGLKIEISFKNANLRHADLRYADLRHADLTGADLQGTNLTYADLRYANLINTNLSGAILRHADLRGADLTYAILRHADLSYADLRSANLSNVDLRHADLTGADLKGASLSNADLTGADLRGADLSGAILYGASLFNAVKNVPYIPLNCPSEGSFIGWKKVSGKLIKLEIPEDARRSSATSMKCRCDKAKVLAITDLDGSSPINSIVNDTQKHIVTYEVGKMVYPDSFDEDRWEECSHGIHFFANKQDAIDY